MTGVIVKSQNGLSKPQPLEPVLHFFQVEIEGAELLQFALLKVLRDFGVGLEDFEEVGVVAAGASR